MENERIYGFTMRDCAEIMSKDGELKAQYGEPAYKPHFQQYLLSRGVDESAFAHAWNGWWQRMNSDPSGQLHARFATIQQQLTMQAHMADVPDASQDAKAGVTLELYAKLMAHLQQGHDVEQLLAQHGLSMPQWQQAQAEWNAAMAADVNHHLTTQYGQLYAQYTPGFQQQMEAQTAAIMAADYEQRAAGIDDEPEEDYTFDKALEELQSAKPATRYAAAHHLANFWDIGDKDDPRLARAFEAIPVMLDCLERHDEFTVSDAEAAAGDLCMFAEEGGLTREQAEEVKGAMQRCLARGEETLETLRAAFAPIANKAVPERVRMQSQIQDYTSLCEELRDKLEDFDDNLKLRGAGGHAGGMPAQESTAMVVKSKSGKPSKSGGGGGFFGLLKSLPLIGFLLRALGL